MNSVRRTRSTSFSISLLTASMRSIRITTSIAKFSGRVAKTLAAWPCADLAENDRHCLRVLILQIVGENLLVYVGELVPHGAAGGTADLLHDVADAVAAQDFGE